MASHLGVLFKVTTFGESHGAGVGCVIDGCPAGIEISSAKIQAFLDRRKPGQSEFTTPRKEADSHEILSGILNGITLGSPIALLVRNTNQKSSDYSDIAKVFRPSHADYTTLAKYGIRAAAGGGRSSARETIGRVAAAGIASQFLEQMLPGIEIVAWVDRIAHIESQVNAAEVLAVDVEKSIVRCPDLNATEAMKIAILEAKAQGDTLGGMIRCAVRGLPAGLGEPVFDKLEADLAKAMLSLPATKSFEMGSGVAGTFLRGSSHNDPFIVNTAGQIRTATNNSGGIQGGISNGMPLEFAVGFKPVSTLFMDQQTVTEEGNPVFFKPQGGRHDACVLPRAVPMVEAMVHLVLADHLLRQIAASRGTFPCKD